MKTIKELAELCDCSKTTINRTIKELNITTVSNKNRLLISDIDSDRIYNYLVGNVAKFASGAPTAPPEVKTETFQEKTETFETNQNTKSKQTDTSDFLKVYSETIEFLKEQLKEKDKQLATKDKQIESLQEQNKLITQAHAFTLKQLEDKQQQEQEQAEIPPETQETVPKKKNIFSWLKK